MVNNNQEHAYDINDMKNALVGLLIGGLVGAGAMLLFAPRSGRQTRALIYQGRIQLRDRTQMGGLFAPLDAVKTAVKAA